MLNVKKPFRLGFILSVVFVILLAACNKAGNYTMDLMNEPNYERGEKTTFVFRVVENGDPVKDLEITALLEMNRMDHGHIEVDFVHVGDGTYEGEAELAMPGEWIATMTIVSGSDEFEKIVEFEVGDGHE